MPIAKFASIREVSSEDSLHRAENLLKQLPGKKWLTKSVGEKEAYVILELTEPSSITGIDIGNEHSWSAEVWVGKAGSPRENFTEILVTSTFMTPVESKNSSIPNRVRCFGSDALVPTVSCEKWQLIKVVCTQPFNKHVQYGLSFIKVHVTEDKTQKKVVDVKRLVPEKFMPKKLLDTSANPSPHLSLGIGKLNLREDSPESDPESSSSLFKRWKTTRNAENADNREITAAASIRNASTPAGLRRLSDSNAKTKLTPVRSTITEDASAKTQQNVLDRNRDRLLFGDDDDEDADEAVQSVKNSKKQRLADQIESDRERLRLEKEKLGKTTDKHKRTNEDSPSTSARAKERAIENYIKKDLYAVKEEKKFPSLKRHSSPTHNATKKIKTLPASTKQYRPFNQLLRGVVLVISGIQNPDRADLRNKALALGAKYKGDWEQGCTHLICAFKNTPKYNQVKGHGKIVTRNWIERCYADKKYIPWRRFALDSAEMSKTESDEEIFDETAKPVEEVQTKKINAERNSSDETMQTVAVEETNVKMQVDDFEQMESHNITSGSDTEDEIERIVQKNKSPVNNKENKAIASNLPDSEELDIYEVPTDEEDYLQEKLKSTKETDTFFNNTKFIILNDVGDFHEFKLGELITKHGGELTDNLNDAQYAIGYKALAKSKTFTGEFVLPAWVCECNKLKKKVATTSYKLKMS